MQLRSPFPRRRLFSRVFLVLSTASLACARDGTPPTAPIAVARIEVTTPASAPFTRDTFSVNATVTDAAGNTLDRSVVWTSSDTTILTVASAGARSGRVTANQPGTASITAAVEGRTGQLKITVLDRPLPPPPDQQFHAFIYSPADGFLQISELPGATASYAHAVNNNGEVVGSVSLPSGSHAFIWSKSEGMTDLGVLPGRSYSTASAINDVGQVAGWSEASSFRWSRSTGMVKLESLPNTRETVALGINNNGDIVGTFFANGARGPFRWTAARGMEELRTPAGEQAEARAINDAGEIVGSVMVPTPEGDVKPIRGVLWSTSGAILDISKCDDLNACSAGALSINQMGAATVYLNGKSYVWSQQGGTVPLPLLNGSEFVYAMGINASGQVTGSGYVANSGTHAFVWSAAAGMRDLGFPPGRSQSHASAINDKGQIVGYAR